MKQKKNADVCLLLEGTYPFVRGGVSSWVHQLISGLSDLEFSIVFVGSRRSDYGDPYYEFPDNLVELKKYYIEDAFRGRHPKKIALSRRPLSPVRALHREMTMRPRSDDRPQNKEVGDTVSEVSVALMAPRGLDLDHFLFGSQTWNYLRERYYAKFSRMSFLDFFWTLRIMHVPVFGLAGFAKQVPEAKIYHAVSTGYAGILGTLIKHKRRKPLVLTEHGIYTKERKIDLYQSEWFDTNNNPLSGALGSPGIRDLWIRFFEGLGRMTYQASSPIISLYDGNRQRQITDGAASDRTRVIVNGIDVDRYRECRARRAATIPPVVGLIGRITPIKDVKTFIRTMAYIIREIPTANGWIIGGSDESPGYAKQCKALVDHLGIEDRVRFLGYKNVTDVLPDLGLLMLTSISEAQPLVVLEAFAAGVPVVTTDVGGCREQIEGRTREDRALGSAGKIAPIADPEALGRAAVTLLKHPLIWCACQKAGIERVERYYTQSSMLESYRRVFGEAMYP